jgi:hypothetical protein
VLPLIFPQARSRPREPPPRGIISSGDRPAKGLLYRLSLPPQKASPHNPLSCKYNYLHPHLPFLPLNFLTLLHLNQPACASSREIHFIKLKQVEKELGALVVMKDREIMKDGFKYSNSLIIKKRLKKIYKLLRHTSMPRHSVL